MKKNKKLIDNTIMLYLLTFSNYFFGFITIPYQTRLLGPEYFGLLAFATSVATFFQLLVDFGFILSATAEVSRNHDDNHKLSIILSSIFMAKLFFTILSLIVLLLLCFFFPILKENILLLMLVFLSVIINSFIPDFMYRGLEKMKFITYRTILIKLLFVVLIFVFLNERDKYYYVPIINIFAALVAVSFAYLHLNRKLNIKFIKIKFCDVLFVIKKSSQFFYSRIATVAYDATNTLLIGIIYPNSNMTGYFSSSSKLIATITSLFSPLADSLYPFMIKTKNYDIIKKLIIIGTPIITAFSILLGLFATPIITFIYGEEFKEASKIFVLLIPIIIIAFPAYLLGFPTLTPMGLEKYANISTIIGALFQIIGFIILYFMQNLYIQNICILTCLTQLIVLFIRIYAVRKKHQILEY